MYSAPAQQYPIEITKIGIYWGSQEGSNSPSLQLAIHLFAAGLPNPGISQFSIAGPTLTDGQALALLVIASL